MRACTLKEEHKTLHYSRIKTVLMIHAVFWSFFFLKMMIIHLSWSVELIVNLIIIAVFWCLASRFSIVSCDFRAILRCLLLFWYRSGVQTSPPVIALDRDSLLCSQGERSYTRSVGDTWKDVWKTWKQTMECWLKVLSENMFYLQEQMLIFAHLILFSPQPT